MPTNFQPGVSRLAAIRIEPSFDFIINRLPFLFLFRNSEFFQLRIIDIVHFFGSFSVNIFGVKLLKIRLLLVKKPDIVCCKSGSRSQPKLLQVIRRCLSMNFQTGMQLQRLHISARCTVDKNMTVFCRNLKDGRNARVHSHSRTVDAARCAQHSEPWLCIRRHCKVH